VANYHIKYILQTKFISAPKSMAKTLDIQ